MFACACLFPCGKRCGWRCSSFLFRQGRDRLSCVFVCFSGYLALQVYFGIACFLWAIPTGDGRGWVLSYLSIRKGVPRLGDTPSCCELLLSYVAAGSTLGLRAQECVTKRESCKFEWIFRQLKDVCRRFSGAKSRCTDAEMAEKTPKLQLKEF